MRCAVEKIYCTFIRVDKEIKQIIVVDIAKGDHRKNLLNCIDNWTRADQFLLFSGNAFVDIDLRIEDEDLFVVVQAVIKVDLLIFQIADELMLTIIQCLDRNPKRQDDRFYLLAAIEIVD